MDKKGYTTAIVKHIDDTLIQQWKTLSKQAENANVFNSYEWFQTCIATNKPSSYEIYTCYKEDRLVALFPVFFTKCFGISVASSLGSNYIVGTPFLLESYNEQLFKNFFSQILQKQNIYIAKIDEKAAKLLKKCFPNLFLSLSSVNPYLEITDDPLRHIPKSTIQRVKRVRQKNAAELHFETYTEKDDLEKYLEKIFSIEQASSKKRRSMDLFSSKDNRILYKSIIRYCKEFVSISILYHQDVPFVYSISFIYHNVYLAFQTAYLSEYRRYVPGKTMTIFLLESLKQQQLKQIDFGGGISSYKQEFTPDYYLQYNLYYSTNFFVLLWWRSINRSRRIKQICFPKKNTRDHEFLFKTLKNSV